MPATSYSQSTTKCSPKINNSNRFTRRRNRVVAFGTFSLSALSLFLSFYIYFFFKKELSFFFVPIGRPSQFVNRYVTDLLRHVSFFLSIRIYSFIIRLFCTDKEISWIIVSPIWVFFFFFFNFGEVLDVYLLSAIFFSIHTLTIQNLKFFVIIWLKCIHRNRDTDDSGRWPNNKIGGQRRFEKKQKTQGTWFGKIF